MSSYPFRLNVTKTVQAVGVLLSQARNLMMNYLKLLKLLYIADRESLKERGFPISGDRPIAMQRGPLLEGVYQLIRGIAKGPDRKLWDEHFQRIEYHLEMRQNPGRDRLSPYEVSKLREVFSRFRDKDEWDMVKHVHRFKEWEKNNPGKSSKRIPLADILDALGKASQIDAVHEEASLQVAAKELFGE